MSHQRPAPCKILREYHKGKTRAVCKSHGWASRWLDNADATIQVAKHEQAVWNRRREGR